MLSRIADRQQLFCELGVHPKVIRCIVRMCHRSHMEYDLCRLQTRRMPNAFFQSSLEGFHFGIWNFHSPPMHHCQNVDPRRQPKQDKSAQ